MTQHLHKGNESQRGNKIMEASRKGDTSLLPQLLARLESDETYENKRHIVRALGNMEEPKVEDKLLELLRTQRGLILGEVAQALGKLKSKRAVPFLQQLRDHDLEWVRQNARFALKQIRNSP